MSQTDRVVITLRVLPEMRDRLGEHASQLGISINALVAMLLDQGLRRGVDR